MKYKTVPIVIRPNSTIEALIRFYNDHNMDKQELTYLLNEFNLLNPQARPPKPGQTVDMPVLDQYAKTKENTPS
jgi:hypothetical protein